MRTTITILPEARIELLDLLTARTRVPSDALLSAIFYCEEIERTFTQSGSTPLGAILKRSQSGSIWWLYANGVWLAFTQQDSVVGPWPFRTKERRITVVAFAAQPDAA